MSFSKLQRKENEYMPKVDWGSFASMLSTESLASPALSSPLCSHENERKEKWLVQVIWAWARIYKRKSVIHH